MARDYAQKKRSSRAAPQRSSIPRWVWIFTTSVAVLFVAGLFVLSRQPSGEPIRLELPVIPRVTTAPAPTQQNQAPAPTRAAPAQPSRQEQLEFYTLLQQTDVLVPDSDLVFRDRNAPTPSQPNATSGAGSSTNSATPQVLPSGQYIVQVASFSRRSDADTLRARLILEGLTNTHITAADLGDRGVFHRVMIGPVNGSREAAGVANTLERLGLQGLVRNYPG